MCQVHFVPFGMKNTSPDVNVSDYPSAFFSVTDPERMGSSAVAKNV